MGYIQSNLLKDENLIYEVQPRWIVFSSGAWMMVMAVIVWMLAPKTLAIEIYGHWTITNLAILALFVVGAYWLTTAYIYYINAEYAVTNKRVIIKIGWIERVSLELLLDKVEGVLVDQTVLGRIFDYGTITIIGTGGTNDQFPFIPDPLLFRKTVRQQIEIYEEGMHKQA